MGRDAVLAGHGLQNLLFQSTLPVWGGTTSTVFLPWAWGFQSTLPVWGGTTCRNPSVLMPLFQSTLPVWGGTLCRFRGYDAKRISIHPPRVGRDVFGASGVPSGRIFQSTLPVWGGTCRNDRRPVGGRFQSTLPVWGGTAKAHKNSL